MQHQIIDDQENALVRCKIVGNLSGPEADLMVNEFSEKLKDKPVRQGLFDLTNAGTIEKREDRQNVTNMIRRGLFSQVAAVGGGAMTRIMAKIIHKMTNQEFELQFFENEEAAINWLKNSRRTG